MKSVFHKVLCYLLASLVFVSSTGFGLVEHSCLVSGKKELLTGDKPCCSGKTADRSPHFSGHSAQLKKDGCCEVERGYAHVDLSSSLVQAMSKLMAGFFALLVSTGALIFHGLAEFFVSLPASFAAPPLAGRTLLIFLHTFLI